MPFGATFAADFLIWAELTKAENHYRIAIVWLQCKFRLFWLLKKHGIPCQLASRTAQLQNGPDSIVISWPAYHVVGKRLALVSKSAGQRTKRIFEALFGLQTKWCCKFIAPLALFSINTLKEITSIEQLS